MSDSSRNGKDISLPPPAPPLPPNRLAQWHRIIAPLGLGLGSRPPSAQAHRQDEARSTSKSQRLESLSPQTTSYKTGIPLAGLDVNDQRTHAVLAGKEILRTIRLQDGKITEDLNLRSAISSYPSAQHTQQGDIATRRREYLPASTVCWSHRQYDHIIATAAVNGRMALYDVNRNSSRTELSWMHEHMAQVNKLDFDPFLGVHLLSASQDKTVRLWDIREPRSVKCFRQFGPRSPVRDAKWSPTDGVEFAICTDDGKVQKWDMRQPSMPKLSINGHESQCYALDWHWDGKHVISAGGDRNIKVWDFDNENRRQKPAYVLRAPQTVMNIRWRPPCWTTEHIDAESGRWQSTQFVTSYKDDPRVHIWDLRRPLLPFREVDRHNKPVSDLLWNSIDLLWTVGNDGTFTQTDVNAANLSNNEVSSCALDWPIDGKFFSFAEIGTFATSSDPLDLAVDYLGIPHERLSGGDEEAISRSLTDDESNLDSAMDSNMSRRPSRAASTRSGKSQGHTPSSTDDFPQVYALNQTMLEQKDVFNNQQVGASSRIEGACTDPEMAHFFAVNYAQPLTAEERDSDPTLILERLENAFSRNATVCEIVSMYRLAQSWRMLCTVIVSELRDGADKNRSRRLERAQRAREITKSHSKKASFSPLVGVTSKTRVAKVDAKTENLISNLFKNVGDLEKQHTMYDVESTSNIATPLAKPLPDSPLSPSGGRFAGIDSAFESIPPLPQSILSSHRTAAAASNALIASPSSATPPSSPDLPRTRNGVHETRDQAMVLPSSSTVANLDQTAALRSRPIQMQNRKRNKPTYDETRQETAWLGEDRGSSGRNQAQPLPVRARGKTAGRPDDVALARRQDSQDSLETFSVSTDGSHQVHDFGQSLESVEKRNGFCMSFDSPGIAQSSFASSLAKRTSSSLRPSHEMFPEASNKNGFEQTDGQTFVGMQNDDTPHSRQNSSPAARDGKLGSNLDRSLSQGGPESDHPTIDQKRLLQPSDFEDQHIYPPLATDGTSVKVAISLPKPVVHVLNPFRTSNEPEAKGHDFDKLLPTINTQDTNESLEYIIEDFKPIDYATYEPRSPFSWSALPLICHTIAFDVSDGIAGSQFATHLLMHTYPYFFVGSKTISDHSSMNPDSSSDFSLAEDLMQPSTNRQIVESLLLAHHEYLLRMKLFVSAAELRQFCVQYNFNKIYQHSARRPGQNLQEADPALEHAVMVSCSRCHEQKATALQACNHCGQPQEPCPICYRLVFEDSERGNVQISDNIHVGTCKTDASTAHNSGIENTGSLWSSCLSCGHTSHLSCMQEWLCLVNSESGLNVSGSTSRGECPVAGCGCDCGPGLIRAQRVERQIRDEEDRTVVSRSSVSPSSGVPKKDPVKVTPSPAADRTRAVLKSRNPREIQSSDESSTTPRPNSGRGLSRTGTGSQRGSLSASSRKSVRVVMPG